jgi:hypothetical protein
MITQLPHELCRVIGSFLDYNSRIEFSRVLEHKDDKFVRKLDSNAHNLLVKVRLNIKLMEDVQQHTLRKSTIRLTKLFRYLANTKDTCIFDVMGKFNATVIYKAHEYAVMDLPDIHPKLVKTLRYNALRVINRLTNYTPKKRLPSVLKIVEII